MIAKKEINTLNMVKWFVQIVDNLPSSQDTLFDFEAEYMDSDLARYLISSCNLLNKDLDLRKSTKVILDQFQREIRSEISRQESLWDGIKDSLSDTTRELINTRDWRVEGDDVTTVLCLLCPRSNSAVSLLVSLGNGGYAPKELRIGKRAIDLTNMSDPVFVKHVREALKDY